MCMTSMRPVWLPIAATIRPRTARKGASILAHRKSFDELTEREILALAIQQEEEDSRIYGDFAEGLRETYPSTAKVFDGMQAEESRHRQMLIDMFRQRFGEHIPLIRRQDVKGF